MKDIPFQTVININILQLTTFIYDYLLDFRGYPSQISSYFSLSGIITNELRLTFLVEQLPLDDVGVLLDVDVIPGLVK